MSARTRSVRAGVIRAIRRLRSSGERAIAWKAFRELPPDYFNVPGSQAVLRAEREARRAASRPSAGGRQP